MVRGVNKKIIEVVDMQSDYFDRAILFVKEHRLGESEEEMKRNAGDFLKEASLPRLRAHRRGRLWFEVAKVLSSAGVGALIMFLFGH